MSEAPQVCISNSGLKSVLNIYNSAYSQTMPVAGRGKTDSKDGDTAMRTARDDDPDVPTQPVKTTRHYVFVPGPNKFLLAAAETRAAKNVDGVVHYFSRVRLWRHRATKHPTKVGHGDLEWWEQDMPQEPIVASHIVGDFPHCVVRDSNGTRRMVFYNFGGGGKRKAVSDEGRQAALKFMRGEGLSETKPKAKPTDSRVWPAGVLCPVGDRLAYSMTSHTMV